MMRALLWLVAAPALACQCERTLAVCREVAYNNAVFIGTVESISPSFLNRWNLSHRPSLSSLNQANEAYLSGQSPSLATLKDAFRRTFPDLPPEERRRLDNAATHQALLSLFSSVLDHGKTIRFRVRTVFRNGDDDDDKSDDKGDADDAADQTFDVWTPFGDCGYDFQPGETYLVFGTTDEETSIIQTGFCTRTRRLTDAGADLAYLYYYRDRKHPAGRLEGFTTFDPLYQVHQALSTEPEKIGAPAAGLTVELKSGGATRYTTSDSFGRFLFDGLAEGDYQATAYAAGFPDTVKLLSGPKSVHAEARGCASQVLLIPKETR